MATKAALDQWAREAVTLALYECLLATAVRLQSHVEEVRGEAGWIRPPDDAWQQWRARRRLYSEPTRPADGSA
jgi:hypothetical protein